MDVEVLGAYLGWAFPLGNGRNSVPPWWAVSCTFSCTGSSWCRCAGGGGDDGVVIVCRGMQALQVVGEDQSTATGCVRVGVCLCECVKVWLPLPLFSSSLAPLSFLSQLFSPPVGRWLSISQQWSVPSPSHSEKPCSRISLAGSEAWLNNRHTIHACVCVCLKYYKEAGLSGRWYFFFSCMLHLSCWWLGFVFLKNLSVCVAVWQGLSKVLISTIQCFSLFLPLSHSLKW